jgi:hypothetical protein
MCRSEGNYQGIYAVKSVSMDELRQEPSGAESDEGVDDETTDQQRCCRQISTRIRQLD